MIEKNKGKIYIAIVVCSFMCIGLMLMTSLHFVKPEPKKVAYQVMLTAYPYKSGEWYQEYNYGYEKLDALFGERCECVFYGEIIESELFRTDETSDSGSNTLLAYALLKVKVIKCIYGELEEEEDVYLVMPYSGYTAEKYSEFENIEGVFIPKVPVVEVTFHDSQRKVEAIGMVGEIDNRLCSDIELLPQLKKMDSLNEVREFWEEKRFCTMGGATQ